MLKAESKQNLVKEILQELKEDPVYKFKLVFGIVAVIPFLAFSYIIFSLWPVSHVFDLEKSIVLFFALFISLCGFVWGYATVKNLFTRIILYATEAKRSEKMKSELVAAISHDFKTPVSILKLSLNCMSDSSMGPVNQKQKDHLESCQEILEHMHHIIATLLDLYKIEAGMVELKLERHNLVDLIEKQIKEFGVVFINKRINLEKKAPGGGLYAFIDPDKIREVIGNLMSNALKYVPETGFVGINAYYADDYVRMEFSNSGGNIPEDKINSIFEKFHRLESTQEGTGLGLAIAKDIVEIHGGRIWAENLPHDFSKFIVILPREPKK